MPHAEFDVVTLSPSTVRVMHRAAHHIYEFALVDDGCGRRVVSREAQVISGRGGALPAPDLMIAAEQVAAATARHTGMID